MTFSKSNNRFVRSKLFSNPTHDLARLSGFSFVPTWKLMSIVESFATPIYSRFKCMPLTFRKTWRSHTGPCKKNARRPRFKSQTHVRKMNIYSKKVTTPTITKVSRSPKIYFRDFGRNFGLTRFPAK